MSLNYGSQFKLLKIYNAYVKGKSPLKNLNENDIKAGNEITGSIAMVIKEVIGI